VTFNFVQSRVPIPADVAVMLLHLVLQVLAIHVASEVIAS
jgi:hypothetical protein